jgi:hypothetical protein
VRAEEKPRRAFLLPLSSLPPLTSVMCVCPVFLVGLIVVKPKLLLLLLFLLLLLLLLLPLLLL